MFYFQVILFFKSRTYFISQILLWIERAIVKGWVLCYSSEMFCRVRSCAKEVVTFFNIYNWVFFFLDLENNKFTNWTEFQSRQEAMHNNNLIKYQKLLVLYWTVLGIHIIKSYFDFHNCQQLHTLDSSAQHLVCLTLSEFSIYRLSSLSYFTCIIYSDIPVK